MTQDSRDPAAVNAQDAHAPSAHGHGAGPTLAYGVLGLALGLLVPVMRVLGQPAADRTSVHLVVACLMPVLAGLVVWSTASRFRSRPGRVWRRRPG